MPRYRDLGGVPVKRMNAAPPRLTLPRLLFIAFIFRPGLATMGPLLPDIRRDLALSGTGTSLLVLAPLVCFGAGAFIVPCLNGRWTTYTVFSAALGLLSISLAGRVLGGTPLLFLGTVGVGAAVAVLNVLVPHLVATQFPARVGPVTGGYSSMFTASAAVAALIAVPVAAAGPWGWRGALFSWSLVAVAALLVWRRTAIVEDPAPVPAPVGAGLWVVDMAKRPGVLSVTTFMGLQSLTFYTVLAWLPSVLRDDGWSPGTAGALLSLGTAAGLSVAWFTPGFAVRRDQEGAVAGALALVAAAGLVGVLLAPGLAPAWVVLIGIGQAGIFPMALLFISRGVKDPRGRGPNLSAFAQGSGYLLAAGGPLLVGVLHDLTGNWSACLVALTLLSLLLACIGPRAANATAWHRSLPADAHGGAGYDEHLDAARVDGS